MGAEPEKESVDAPAGTYRTISEEELAENNKSQINSNMVKENGENCPDGADEKMLAEEEKKIAAKTDHAEVKFVSGDHQNGDTKIDILEIKQAFTGLTKEELMKYSNDPFWVRLRWIMFVGFWLLWLGMLGGAIYIIIGAPKCAPPPPKTWWEEGPLLDLDDANTETNPEKFFQNLDSKLPLIKSFKGVFIPENVNPGPDAYTAAILNKSDETEFKTFAAKAKENNIKLIVDLTPNFVDKTSEWFEKSEKGEAEYKDYFVWVNSSSVMSAGDKALPNNWLTLSSKPAWSYSEVRKQYYLHQFDANTPDLNFRNPEVVKEFDKVLQYWMENGASGVRLSKAVHLLVDQNFANETFPTTNIGATQDQYSFYHHDKTTYQNGLADILLHWKAVVNQYADGQGLLMLKEDVESLESLTYNGTIVVDLPRLTRTKAMQPSLNRNADSLFKSIQSVFNLLGKSSWPSWKYESNKSVSSELRIVTMLLPGTPVMTLDQVVVSENKSALMDDEYKSLVALRALPSLMYGGFDYHLLSNDTVYAYTRLKSGNPGFIVVYNPTMSVAHTNMTEVKNVPSELTVNLLSKNYNEKNVFLKAKVPTNNVAVSANSAIILTYAPVSD